MEKLFSGSESVRVRGEHRRLIATLSLLPVTLTVVGIFFQTVTLHSLILIVVGAMLYVALSRGRLLGGGVRIDEGQFDEIYAVARECARLVGVPVPHVFVRDDPFVPVVAVGTGEPYALVISAQWIELFNTGELRFMIGRELAHIAAGHTRITSILSANGRENPIVSVGFGAWLRAIEYSADRAGLLCCGSLNTAFSAIAVSTFQRVGRRIDLHAFAEQRRELDAEPALRLGEWTAATPYATNRIARLAAFAKDPLYQLWAQRFAQRLAADAPYARSLDETSSRYAGPWRRLAALTIDYAVVAALLPGHGAARQTRALVRMTSREQAALAQSDAPSAVVHFVQALANWHVRGMFSDAIVWLLVAVYAIALVAFAGQTLGMMICDLRVVGDRRERIGLGRTLARYACLLVSWSLIVGLWSMFRRVQLFERWSRTRLVSGSTGSRS